MKKPTITQKAMNLVYPQTNNDWANEVNIIFFADAYDLMENGWADPWNRPIDRTKLSKWEPVNEDSMKDWEMCEIKVRLGRDDEYEIPLCIYRTKTPPNNECYKKGAAD